MKLSDDRNSAAITINANVNADELDALIGWLAWNMDARFARGMADYIVRRTDGGPSVDLIDEQTANRH